MLKKGKKIHQSPSSKTEANEERKNWPGFYLFILFQTVSTEDWSFGAGRQATVLVEMKAYQRRPNKRIRSKERNSVGQWVDF